MNPKDRFNAQQTLAHEWIANKAPKAQDVSLKGTDGTNFVENLRGFRSQNKFKKATLQVIAFQFNDAEILKLKKIFQSLDTDGSGTLNLTEVKEGLQKSKMEVPPDLQQILEDVD